MPVSLLTDAAVAGRLSEPEHRRLRRRLNRMLRAIELTEGAGEPPYEACLTLTDDGRIHELNRDYRDKDRPTDVLAFAQREGDGPAAEFHRHILGDIIISLDTAAGQAKADLTSEVEFLATHGLCHLIGYDHRDDAEEAEMNARMARLQTEAARSGKTRAA